MVKKVRISAVWEELSVGRCEYVKNILLRIYIYKPGDFNYRVRPPLVVARYHRNRWIKTDK